jgi:hypothetical protein
MAKKSKPNKNEKHPHGQSVTGPDRIQITMPRWLNDKVNRHLEITRKTKSGLIADLLEAHLKKASTRENEKDIAQEKENSESNNSVEELKRLFADVPSAMGTKPLTPSPGALNSTFPK